MFFRTTKASPGSAYDSFIATPVPAAARRNVGRGLASAAEGSTSDEIKPHECPDCRVGYLAGKPLWQCDKHLPPGSAHGAAEAASVAVGGIFGWWVWRAFNPLCPQCGYKNWWKGLLGIRWTCLRCGYKTTRNHLKDLKNQAKAERTYGGRI